MFPIKFTDSPHQPNQAGLLLTFGQTDSLPKKQHERLAPFVKAALQTSNPHYFKGSNLSNNMQVVELSSNQGAFAFAEASQETLNSITDSLNFSLGEAVIVEHPMAGGPTVRHRPLQFTQVSPANTSLPHIQAQYVQLGEKNTFELALDVLGDTFPSVVNAKE